jgi:hypothetical protein
VLLVLAIAEFMLTLDLSIVNVALPSIRGALGFSQGSPQWVINAYALTFAGFLLCGGRAVNQRPQQSRQAARHRHRASDVKPPCSAFRVAPGRRSEAASMRIAPTGTLAKKIQRQDPRPSTHPEPACACSGGQPVRILKRHAFRAGVGWSPRSGTRSTPQTSRISPHALRRAWATHAHNHDHVSIDVIAMALGHSDIGTTRRHDCFPDDERGFEALGTRRL